LGDLWDGKEEYVESLLDFRLFVRQQITSVESLLLSDPTSRLTLLRILLALSFSLRNSSTTIDFSCRILMISICKCVFSSSRHRIRIARSAFVLRGHTSPDQLDALNLNLMRLRT
jgi:hypothetical protein